MTDREPRTDWGQEHRQDVHRFKLRVAIATLAVAMPLIVWSAGIPQYFGVGMGSIALWRLFPDAHPLISAIVDKIPGMASKGGAS